MVQNMHLGGQIRNALLPSPSHSKLGIGFLCLGLCIGVAVRLGMLCLVDYRFDVGDTVYYQLGALNLREHHIYSADIGDSLVPSYYRPPFYSFFIALIPAVFGHFPISVQLAQIVLSLITALLTTRIAAHCVPDAAPWVFGFMMLSPYEAVYTGAVVSETLATFLLVAVALAILTVEGLKRWVVGGVLLGFCVLTRDTYWPLVILGASFRIAFGGGRKIIQCIEALVFVLSFCLVVLPWTLRNYSVADQFVLVSKGRLGIALWMGTWATNADFTKTDGLGQERVYPPEAFRNETEKKLVDLAFNKSTSQEQDSILKSLAIQRILDEPAKVIARYIVRAPHFWLGTRFDVFQLNAKWFPRGSLQWILVKSILWGLNSLFLLLGIVGIAHAWFQRNNLLILMIPIGYTVLAVLPLVQESRYTQPVYPFVLIFAGIALTVIRSKLNCVGLKRI